MTKAQIDALVAKAVADALAAAGKGKVEAKTYQAGVLLEGETCTVPKGHVALLVPESTDKATNRGQAYVMNTRGVALHKKTGEGFKFQVWAYKAEA